jgi:Phytanoyl-CoA dioxygenase (PhyH)
MRIEGHIDQASPGAIEGWIADRKHPAARLEIEVVHGDAVLGRCVADLYREDLQEAGIGDGRYGFKFPLPIVLARSEVTKVGVRLADSSLYLRNSEKLTPGAADTVSRFGGFWVDRFDWLDRLAAKHRNGELSDELSQAIFSFVRDGYYIVKGAVSERAVDALNAQIEKFWHEPPLGLMIETFEPDGVHKYIPVDIKYRAGTTKLLDLYAFSSLAREAVAAPKVMDFLVAVFEDKPKAFQGLYFHKGSEQRIHKDTAYVKIDTNPMHLVATWLALEDVTPGTGELCYYIGSHRAPDYLFGGSNKWMESHPEEHPQFLDSLDNDAARFKHAKGSFLARKGDVLIWHGDLAHGGAPITSPGATRKSLVTHITAASDDPFYRRENAHRMLTTERCVFMSSYADIGG